MKIMRLLLVLFSLAAAAMADPAPPRVALQPFGPVKQEDLAVVKAGIVALYGVGVEVLPARPMPKSAYYPPRERYKADRLLNILETDASPDFTKIIGLTVQDISTSKGEIEDWGIFGLGNLGGRACVVSTFRLRSGKVSEEVFQARLVKVVNHELGHTFGLDHCPTVGCLMQDAGGKIAAVDGESGKPCPQCAAYLPLVK